MPRVLHVLSQRPSLTGSGVTLDAHVRHAAAAGWVQHAVVGVPVSDPAPPVGDLPSDAISPLVFETGPLEFPLPGMSDVMPYPSTRFTDMVEAQRAAYREAWRSHLSDVLDRFRPDLIQSHHLWIVSSLLKEVAPATPVVTQCHATGLRQMRLCPHLADEVRHGCARHERVLALHAGDAREIVRQLGIEESRVRVVGAGYRDELFHARGRARACPPRLAYVGKYSAAKGLPWLLEAVEASARARPDLELHVVGSGAGAEADALRERMQAMAPTVVLHGVLSQPRLAGLLRTCRAFVLPSFYEGVPLVVVEAMACGCRPVVTEVAGVQQELAPHLGTALVRVPLPRLEGVDRPRPEDLPVFVDDLRRAIDTALDQPFDGAATVSALRRYTWRAVFERVEAVWLRLCGRREMG